MHKRKLIEILQFLLMPVEWLLGLFSSKKWVIKPVFIVGAPRSGTTLISQIVFNSIAQKAYLANVDNYFPRLPRLSSFFKKAGRAERLKSKYGRTRGLDGLSEAGNVWNQWFPDEQKDGFNYTPANYFSSKQIYQIRKYFKTQAKAQRSEIFVNKNVKHCGRILTLNEIFPNAFYVVVQRNLIDNTASMLKARVDVGGSKEKWLWAKPKDYEQLIGKSPEETVAGQIALLNSDLKRDLQRIDKERVVFVDYDTLMTDGTPYLEEKLRNSFKNWSGTSFAISNTNELRLRKKGKNMAESKIKMACEQWL